MGDFAFVVFLIGLLFACIWAAAWIVAKIISLPSVLLRRVFYGESVAVPKRPVLQEQHEVNDQQVPAKDFEQHSSKISPITNTGGCYPDNFILTDDSRHHIAGPPLKCCVLGSGSKGNACFLQADDFGLLIDIGLGPRQIANRLSLAGADWNNINAVKLTHTDSDHWNAGTLRHLKRLRIPLYCHVAHQVSLSAEESFNDLRKEELVRDYTPTKDFLLSDNLKCRPIRLRHDGGATFGFRFECCSNGIDEITALGYVADLGCWDTVLVEALCDLDALALEFNHDAGMQRASGRHPHLIERVLSDDGHLSNEQATQLLREIVRLSKTRRLRDLVQLHLSSECNTPEMAQRSALSVLSREVNVHTARQDKPGPFLHIGALYQLQ